MIDFDKVLEHVGGFGKYQITSKFPSIDQLDRLRNPWNGN